MDVSARFLQTALDGIDDCINIVDKKFQIIFINEAASKRVGKNWRTMLGNKCYAQLWGKSAPCENCVTGKAFETGKTQQTIKWEIGPDGKKHFMEHFAFPITDKEGNVEYTVEIFRDITERKLLEEEREQQRLELGKRVRELRHAYEELKSLQNQLLQAEKMASIGLLASSLAHELDTPLATISGYCELLAEDIQDKNFLGRVKTISEQVIKCQKTIRNLLDFSRKSNYERKLCNIHQLINSILSLVEHRLIIHKIRLHKTFDDQIPPLLVDGNQIQQVILNLVNNAVDALPQGGDVFIETRVNREAKSFEIIFEDNGIGISDEHRKYIFSPFFTTKEPGKGTGLGLLICKNIILAHNGKITLESRVGNGTKFVILLPL
ncbi:MAG: PAS domain-containing protein [Candidatus Brocadia sp. AMX2]|uniref:histidine kinase n=1 Tax=Candidatus Brocadia sinica JPN1 TaxID=1197129 RepID=A0ABQ0JZ24_9BACT|nr:MULTISPECIES: ATP-binding protein [Brocadia]KXK30904.1 MAG: two-component sensor kinase [Candidatus Brocadia sinica]MBC6931220.1 PAS domain-containing protein [Candidatus Brocadia sp.]MBL1168609.1 PAS domain-containing protein [Candidatus Brocadia sp. AMX1]NOG40147.1 PAS domain-containing protein [Planctomycetota bacterium]KAA0246078.1 MAG: PAS domain-containing protein [Candidatus Brocadia sp. AMX2]